MPSFSLLSPMADKPYAIGERPGGSEIPTQPLLSGKEAWASLSGYYDHKHGDSKLMSYGDGSDIIRPTDRPEEKKAATELLKMAKGKANPLKLIGGGTKTQAGTLTLGRQNLASGKGKGKGKKPKKPTATPTAAPQAQAPKPGGTAHAKETRVNIDMKSQGGPEMGTVEGIVKGRNADGSYQIFFPGTGKTALKVPATEVGAVVPPRVPRQPRTPGGGRQVPQAAPAAAAAAAPTAPNPITAAPAQPNPLTLASGSARQLRGATQGLPQATVLPSSAPQALPQATALPSAAPKTQAGGGGGGQPPTPTPPTGGGGGQPPRPLKRGVPTPEAIGTGEIPQSARSIIKQIFKGTPSSVPTRGPESQTAKLRRLQMEAKQRAGGGKVERFDQPKRNVEQTRQAEVNRILQQELNRGRDPTRELQRYAERIGIDPGRPAGGYVPKGFEPKIPSPVPSKLEAAGRYAKEHPWQTALAATPLGAMLFPEGRQMAADTASSVVNAIPDALDQTVTEPLTAAGPTGEPGATGETPVDPADLDVGPSPVVPDPEVPPNPFEQYGTPIKKDPGATAPATGGTAAAGPSKPPAKPPMETPVGDFIEKYWPHMAGAGAGAGALYLLYRHMAAKKEEERRKERQRRRWEALPKMAAADPAKFASDHPIVAGFLVKCAEAELGETQIEMKIAEACRLHPAIKEAFEKLAASTKTPAPPGGSVNPTSAPAPVSAGAKPAAPKLNPRLGYYQMPKAPEGLFVQQPGRYSAVTERMPRFAAEPQYQGAQLTGLGRTVDGEFQVDPKMTQQFLDYSKQWQDWQQNRRLWEEQWKSQGDVGAQEYWRQMREYQASQDPQQQGGRQLSDVVDMDQFRASRERGRQQWQEAGAKPYEMQWGDVFGADEELVRAAAQGDIFREHGEGTAFGTLIQQDPEFANYVEAKIKSVPDDMYEQRRAVAMAARDFYGPRVDVYDYGQRAYNTFGAGQEPSSHLADVPGAQTYQDVFGQGSFRTWEPGARAGFSEAGPVGAGTTNPWERIRGTHAGHKADVAREHMKRMAEFDESTYNWMLGTTQKHFDPKYMAQEYESRGMAPLEAARKAAQDRYLLMHADPKNRGVEGYWANLGRNIKEDPWQVPKLMGHTALGTAETIGGVLMSPAAIARSIQQGDTRPLRGALNDISAMGRRGWEAASGFETTGGESYMQDVWSGPGKSLRDAYADPEAFASETDMYRTMLGEADALRSDHPELWQKVVEESVDNPEIRSWLGTVAELEKKRDSGELEWRDEAAQNAASAGTGERMAKRTLGRAVQVTPTAMQFAGTGMAMGPSGGITYGPKWLQQLSTAVPRATAGARTQALAKLAPLGQKAAPGVQQIQQMAQPTLQQLAKIPGAPTVGRFLNPKAIAQAMANPEKLISGMSKGMGAFEGVRAGFEPSQVALDEMGIGPHQRYWAEKVRKSGLMGEGRLGTAAREAIASGIQDLPTAIAYAGGLKALRGMGVPEKALGPLATVQQYAAQSPKWGGIFGLAGMGGGEGFTAEEMDLAESHGVSPERIRLGLETGQIERPQYTPKPSPEVGVEWAGALGEESPVYYDEEAGEYKPMPKLQPGDYGRYVAGTQWSDEALDEYITEQEAAKETPQEPASANARAAQPFTDAEIERAQAAVKAEDAAIIDEGYQQAMAPPTAPPPEPNNPNIPGRPMDQPDAGMTNVKPEAGTNQPSGGGALGMLMNSPAGAILGAVFGASPNAIDGEKVEKLDPKTQQQIPAATTQINEAVQNAGAEGIANRAQDVKSEGMTETDKEGIENVQNQTGLDFESAMQMYDNMDDGAKVLMGLGLGLGLVGLLGGIASDDGGLMPILFGMLGLGVAGGTAAHQGLFGQQAQGLMQGLFGGGQQDAVTAADMPALSTEQKTEMAKRLGSFREGGLELAETKEMFDDPTMRGHLLSMEDADVMPILTEAVKGDQTGQIADQLKNLANPASVSVMTTPKGEKIRPGFFIGPTFEGYGFGQSEASRMHALAKQYYNDPKNKRSINALAAQYKAARK